MTEYKQTGWMKMTENHGSDERPSLVRVLQKEVGERTYRVHVGNTHSWAEIIDGNGKVLSSIDYGQGRRCRVFNPDNLIENSEDFYSAVHTEHAKRNLALLFSQGDGVARERELWETYSKPNLPRYVDEDKARLNRLYKRHAGGSDLVNNICGDEALSDK
jgi:hypothetical protein